MNWRKIIQTLVDRGCTQQQIAKEAGCGQSLVSALLNGQRGKRVSWEIGDALLRFERTTRGDLSHDVVSANHSPPLIPASSSAT